MVVTPGKNYGFHIEISIEDAKALDRSKINEILQKNKLGLLCSIRMSNNDGNPSLAVMRCTRATDDEISKTVLLIEENVARNKFINLLTK